MRKRMVVGVLAVLALLGLLLTASSVVAGPPWPGSELPDIQGEVIMAAMVGEKINYQGRLTDSGGSPLTGTYDFGFHFWDEYTGGTDLGHSDVLGVAVSDGLFNVKIPVTQSWFNGQALWLGVYVRSSGGSWESLGPRQEILPVPYALSLRPGAKIQGTVNSAPALSIVNDGAGTASGLVAQGTAIGVGGVSTNGFGMWGIGGASGIGVVGYNTGSGTGVHAYSPSGAAIYAAGKIQSNADSYIFVPGTEATLNAASSGVDFGCYDQGQVVVDPSSAGTKVIMFGVVLPGVLYGQPVEVEEATVFYKTTNSSSYIASTRVLRQKDVGAPDFYTLVNNSTHRTSTTYTSYSVTPTAYNTLSAQEGFVSVRLSLYFASAGHDIVIGGVRLRLGHDG